MDNTNKKTNYKDTLNLPRTSFPMKAGLPKKEPETLLKWEGATLYRSILDARGNACDKFVLHDGPPYANGHIHVGHVLNKILKDIIVKYRSMRGFCAPFVPGWDCHGLPVEHQLLQELDISKHDIDKVEFRKKAREYAMKFVKIQAEEFKRLGIFADWKKPYLTLTERYESDILSALADLYEKGYVYRDVKPVNWCASCETALAEAEVEYYDKTSLSVYVKFDAGKREKNKKLFLVIWTTTPWTLPANVAVALNPDIEYSYVSVRDELWVIARNLVDIVMEKAGIVEFEVVKTQKGNEIINNVAGCRHPFEERDSVLVAAEYVTVEEGTGCVHIAPGHGQDDHITGKKYSLPTIMPVDDKGRFTKEAGDLEGQFVLDADSAIIKKMEELGVLVLSEKVSHSYPHCWRCKSPIIFRATRQWFLKVDHEDLRERIMEIAGSDVSWLPVSGKERMSSMIRGRPDWCLSRQRYWGVPIPSFKCAGCGVSFTDEGVIRKTAELTLEYGSDVWFEKSVEELIPAGKKCPGCGGDQFEKENDILDVWFDSGVSHRAVLKDREELSFPADMYLEGSDQHRGWFQSSMITSVALSGTAPYRQVLTHGFVVDGAGKKMSKSTGNVVRPEDVMKKYGADILRLWVASSDYETDIKISDEILERLADGYRKIRNTFRFLLSNLYDYDHSSDKVDFESMGESDRWMLSRLSALVQEVTDAYEKSEFHTVYRRIYDFCVYEVSALYMDFMKDPLYILPSNSFERRSHQTVIFNLLSTLTRMMAPILCFTTDEVWEHFTFSGKKNSVHLELWSTEAGSEYVCWRNSELEEKWEKLLVLRDVVMKRLEEERARELIGSSLDAAVIIDADGEEQRNFLEQNRTLLSFIFKVSAVRVIGSASQNRISSDSHFSIKVEKAPGKKCPRCWNYSDTIEEGGESTEICARCRDAVSGRGGK